MCTEIASIIIINYFTCEIERGVNNNPLHTKLQLMAKWLRKVSVWFSKASSSGSHEQSECVVSDTEAQDSLECTLYHTRDQRDSDSNSAQSDSHVSSDSEESDGPTPPPPKVDAARVKLLLGIEVERLESVEQESMRHMLQNTRGWFRILVGKELCANFLKSTTVLVVAFPKVRMVHSLQSHSLSGAKLQVLLQRTTNF